MYYLQLRNTIFIELATINILNRNLNNIKNWSTYFEPTTVGQTKTDNNILKKWTQL